MDILSINELLEALEELGGEQVIKATRKRPISSFALRDLYSSYCDNHDYLLFLAQYPLLPSELALTIASELKNSQEKVAAALAGNPRTPQQGLNLLARHPSVSVRLAVARNPNVSPKECQLLAQDEASMVRAAIAANPSLPAFLQFILAEDSDATVKIALAARENLDSDVAYRLSLDSSSLVKATLVHNSTLDPELYQMWADSDDEILQSLLLRRLDGYPSSVRETLRYSPHPSVRLPALDSAPLSEPEMLWLADSDAVDDRAYLAQKPGLPAAIQNVLGCDTSEKVRRYLAANPDLQQDVAKRIATSHDLQACAALAKNPQATPDALNELCLHPDPRVATLAAYRDDLNHTHWDLLINHRQDHSVAEHLAFLAIECPKVDAPAAERFALSPNPSLRAFAATAPTLSPASLATLAADHCDKVRERVAGNPNLPELQLRKLCYDANPDIANAAERSIASRTREATTQRLPSSLSPSPAESRTRPPEDSRRKILNRIISFFKE